MRARLFILLCLLAQVCSVPVITAQSPNMTGTWNIEVSFGAGAQHSLRFDAQPGGKGTFVLTDASAQAWGETKPSEANWTLGEEKSVTFSGQVEFPIGNVGRDAGTLTCTGKFETADLITGEVDFSPLVGDGPSKHGTFKATRAAK